MSHEGNGSSREDSSHLNSYPLCPHKVSLPAAEDWIYSSPLSLHQLSTGVHGLLTSLIFLMPVQQTWINAGFLACFLNCNPPAVFTFYEPELSCKFFFVSFANTCILCAFCFASLICPDTLVVVSRSVGFGGAAPTFLSVFHCFWRSGKLSLQLPHQTY